MKLSISSSIDQGAGKRRGIEGLLWRPLMIIELAAWVLGAVLFSGDIAPRGLAGRRLFPMAAPTGGIILIGAWFGLAAAAVGAQTRS
jgi:uncharacterized membrane protein YgdD (TMEM256/DUF423 family)